MEIHNEKISELVFSLNASISNLSDHYFINPICFLVFSFSALPVALVPLAGRARDMLLFLFNYLRLNFLPGSVELHHEKINLFFH